MFHKILVAMDTSAISKDVFSEALSLATAIKGSLMLLHVVSAEEDGTLKYAYTSKLGILPDGK